MSARETALIRTSSALLIRTSGSSPRRGAGASAARQNSSAAKSAHPFQNRGIAFLFQRAAVDALFEPE